jgi:murein L,D-transpeptidase YafK
VLRRNFISSGISWIIIATYASSATISQKITEIVVKKSKRKLYLFSGDEIIKSYKIDLGFTPEGHKNFEGDGKTPEGSYKIDRKNANSKYHLSIGISYPNPKDRHFAELKGKLPGGDIFIHGTDKPFRWFQRDWTAGCIALSNKEISEIYSLVEIGTPIFIEP